MGKCFFFFFCINEYYFCCCGEPTSEPFYQNHPHLPSSHSSVPISPMLGPRPGDCLGDKGVPAWLAGWVYVDGCCHDGRCHV